MKITKRPGPPEDLVYFDDELDLKEKDVEDVVEIFNTPLTGSYNWDYTVAENRIKKLYELGKELNWNGSIDLDWSYTHPADEPLLGVDGVEFPHEQLDAYKALSEEEKIEFDRHETAEVLCQFLHGEQGALLVASQIASCAPTFNAKMYAASQTFDEARHVEVFNRYLQEKIGFHYPINQSLKALLDKVLTDLINPVPSKLSFRDSSVNSKAKSPLKYPLSSTAVSNKILYPLPISLLFNKRGNTRFFPPPMVGPVIPSTCA